MTILSLGTYQMILLQRLALRAAPTLLTVLTFVFLWSPAQSAVQLPLFVHSQQQASTTTALPKNSATMQLNSAFFDQTSFVGLDSVDVPDFAMSDGLHTLHCRRLSLLQPGSSVVAGTLNGDQSQTLEKHCMLVGSVSDIANSFVYLCVFRSYCVGYIEVREDDGVRRILIAPDDIHAEHPVMVVYNQADLPIPPHPGCEAEFMPDYAMRTQQCFEELWQHARNKKGQSPAIQNAQTLIAQIALECDTKYYQEQSSNFSQAANYILITMGAVSAVWERDMNIRLQIPYLRIWTDGCPYSGDNGTMLGQVANYWNTNMQSIRRTTTYLVTSYAGGLAWVNVLCGGYAYAVGGIAGGTNFPIKSYAWDVDVMAHELGHNFGSPHTHSCSWAPPVDSCVNAEGGCYPNPLPRPGTIMSYCHLTSYGTQLRFHPRVATLIRSSAERVLGNCIRNGAVRYSVDCALSQVQQPPNGATMATLKSFAPQVLLTNLGLNAVNGANSVMVTVRITNPSGSTAFYNSSRSVTSLDSMASISLVFDSCSLQTGTYIITATCTISNDGDLANNTLTRPFIVGNPGKTSVHCVYPNGAEHLRADSVVSIQWTHSGIDKLIIELSTDAGLSWRSIQTFYSAASQSYQWTVPALSTRSALIRLVDMANSTTRDQSDAVFNIDLDHDYQLLEFTTPRSDTTIQTPIIPRVSVRNNGTLHSAAKTVFNVYWRDSGELVSSDTSDVPTLSQGQVAVLSFAKIQELPPGQFIMLAKVLSSDDRNASNDSLGRSFNHIGGIAPPVGLRAQAINKAVLLWWGPSTTSDIESYQILRSTDGASFSSLIKLSSKLLSYVDETVLNDHDYRYTVIAVLKGQNSIYSNRVLVRPSYRRLYDSLSSIKALVPENGAKTVPNPARFVWSSPVGAQWYQVQISKGSGMSALLYNGILDDRHPLSLALEFRQNYCWRVRAINMSGMTSWSTTNLFTLGNNCSGNCLNFSAASDNLKAAGFSWPASSAVTVEFWNYVKAADLAKENVALRVGPDVVSNRFNIHAPYSDGNLYWDYGNINTSGRLSVNYRPYLDKWTHVCVVSDGSTMKAIYLDGKLVASSETADAPSALNGLTLGISFYGRMDEVHFWNRVLSGDEIFSTMNRRITPGTPNLACSYRFDEPLQDTLIGDEGFMQTFGALARSGMRSASDAPINCITGATLQTPQLAEPTNTSNCTFPYPALRWNAVAAAFGYELQVAADAGFSSIVYSNPNCAATSCPVYTLSPQKTYYWRVRSLSGAALSEWSAPWSFRTDSVCNTMSLHYDGPQAAKLTNFSSPKGEVTVEWWNYVDASEVRNATAFAVGTKDDVNNRFQCTGPWSDKRLYWDYGSLNNGRVSVDYSPYLGKWTHIALVSNARDYQAIYLNGKLAAYALRADSARDLNELVIGQAMAGTNGYIGRIADFRIWDRVRTQEELQRYMNTHLQSHPNLLASWRMDEGDGLVLRESNHTDTSHALVLSKAVTWQRSAIPMSAAEVLINGPDTTVSGSDVVYTVYAASGLKSSWSCTNQGSIVSQADSGSMHSVRIHWTSSDTTATLRWSADTSASCSASGEKQVWLRGLSDVSSTASQQSDWVYPNPADHFIHIKLPEGSAQEIGLYSLEGHLLESLKLPQYQPSSTQSLDCSTISHGYYVVRCLGQFGMRSYIVLVLHNGN